MLIYQVTATVEPNLMVDYERYMTRHHIPELMATGYFASAFFAKKGNEYKVGYHADSSEHLDQYLENEAGRLRADFAEHFPTGVVVSRQVLDIIALFPSP
jgi:hypothetical protein